METISISNENIKELKEKIDFVLDSFQKIKNEITKKVAGYTNFIELILLTLFCGGHVLIEGVPGVGKTLLIKTISEVLGLKFKRIQFTPDLMPSDILGTHILIEDEKGQKILKFNEGPVFCNVLLADEINRATAKTQSALLECMAENTVSISNNIYKLDLPFFVLATENPLEMEGTFSLPEAQLDRFMIKINLPYPNIEQLDTIVTRFTTNYEPKVSCVINKDEILNIQRLVKEVIISNDVKDYAINLIKKTHPDFENAPAVVKKYVKYGSSPRGLLSLILMSKAYALFHGRLNVSYDDLKYIIPYVLNHRIILNFEGLASEVTIKSIIEQIIS